MSCETTKMEESDGLSMARDVWLGIRSHGTSGYPLEVVGALVGSADRRRVRSYLPLENEFDGSRHNRYAVGPEAWRRIEKQLHQQGDELVGFYHTHPDHPAQYSEVDRDRALPNLSYIILSVVDGEAQQMCCWQLREDRSAMDAQYLYVENES